MNCRHQPIQTHVPLPKVVEKGWLSNSFSGNPHILRKNRLQMAVSPSHSWETTLWEAPLCVGAQMQNAGHIALTNELLLEQDLTVKLFAMICPFSELA